jgi:hypothetical protein
MEKETLTTLSTTIVLLGVIGLLIVIAIIWIS